MEKWQRSVKFRVVTFFSFGWMLPVVFAVLIFGMDYGWDVPIEEKNLETLLIDFFVILLFWLHCLCILWSAVVFVSLLFVKKENRFPGYGAALFWNGCPLAFVVFLFGENAWMYLLGPITGTWEYLQALL